MLLPRLSGGGAATAVAATLLTTAAAVVLCPAIARAQAGGAAATRTAAGNRVRYGNIVNTRFATVSSGPQSSLIVDVPRGATQTQIREAVSRSIRADWRTRARQMSPLVQQLKKNGILSKNALVPVSTTVMVREDGNIVIPSQYAAGKSRAVGNGELTFRYEGFDEVEQAFLEAFVSQVYPIIVEIYGRPAVSGQVTLRKIGAANEPGGPSDVTALRFGTYDASSNTIFLPIYPESGLSSWEPAILLNMVKAFHGPAVFQYDAWEEGFARAATSVILRRPEFHRDVPDPTATFSLAMLPFYDLMNQPGLGNPTFFPAAQADLDLDEAPETGGFTFSKMMLPRMGMSGAAWLKAYIENPNFFRQFNERYYAQFTPGESPSLAGNIPALRQIAEAVLPNGVEGQNFNAWYERQYVLDTSVSLGKKLYGVVLPGPLDTDDDTQAHLVVLDYFETFMDTDGSGQPRVNERLLDGRAYATYFDAENARINFGLPAEEAPIVQGEAFFTINVFQRQGTDATKITADFHVGNNTSRVYFPAGFGGDFQGVILGPGAGGSVSLEHTSVPSGQTRTQSGNVEGAAFGINLDTPYRDLGKTVVRVTNGADTATYQVNTGDDIYYAVLRPSASGGKVTEVVKAFPAGVPTLVSFPVQPLATAPDQALSLPANDFVLSYWNSGKSTPGYESAFGDPTANPLGSIIPGRGYFFKPLPTASTENVVVRVTGTAPATDSDFTVSAPAGWNLIGSPFSEPIDLSRVLVQYLQNEPVTWDEAIEKSYISGQVWEWLPEQRQYQEATQIDGTNWKGYWFRVYIPNGVTLLLPGPDAVISRATSRSGRATTSAAKAQPDWAVRLRARLDSDDTSISRAAMATFGTVKGATRGFDPRYDAEAPPSVMPGVTVSFPHSDFGKASGRYVSDFRESNRQATSYQVQVATPQPGRVALTWENLNSLPRNARVTLIDKETGQRVAMRSRSAYTFAASGEKLTRDFQVEVDLSARLRPLMISNLSNTTVPGRSTNGGRSIAVSYTLSGDADVSVEVNAISGQTLRRVTTGRSQGAGRQSVVWDGRAENGAALPAGVYILRITAQGEDGTRIIQQRPLTILR